VDEISTDFHGIGYGGTLTGEGSVFIQKLLFRLDQITGKYGKTSMLGAIQFDFPIRRPNYRFVNEAIFSAVIGTLVPADGAGVVRASVDVNHIGHNANYTAHLADERLP